MLTVLTHLSRVKTRFIIKQLLTIEVLDTEDVDINH